MLKLGDLLDGKYKILHQIGKGGMSIVYLAMDTRLNKQWAIKELKKISQTQNHECILQSAIAEANLMKRFDHPGLPRIVDIIDLNDSICVVMDYIEGKSLDFILNEYGIPTQEKVIEWGKQICSVLIYLHSQDPPIIYRDMKPGNIMLKPDGTIKMIDFGIAREYKQLHTNDTVLLGTRGYAAPEQYMKDRQTDPRTDIYCLGVTLHHLVTGISPNEDYDVLPIRSINPNLSGGLENILIRCTQKNPEYRYQSCNELLYALEHYEKEDSAYKKSVHQKLLKFTCCLILSLLCFISGISCLSLYHFKIQSNYQNLILLANKQNSFQSQKSLYFKAISILPTHSEAYYALVDSYKEAIENGIPFSSIESQSFLDHISISLKTLRENNPSMYADVCFQIGKLYWYYLDLDSSFNKREAAHWFDDVVLYGKKNDEMVQTATIYSFIGNFQKQLNQLRNEGSNTNDLYKQYFEKLTSLFEYTSSEEEMIRLEMDSLIVDSIEGYARDFYNASISKEEVISFYNRVLKDVKSINGYTDKTMNLKEEILSNEDEVRKGIDIGYEKGR